MNFLEGKPYDVKNARMKSITVIKFTDNIRFDLDAELIKREISSRFNDVETNTFRGKGLVTEVATGVTYEERFALIFRGFFRSVVGGKLIIPEGIHPKDYDKYSRIKPYQLTFFFEDLKEGKDVE